MPFLRREDKAAWERATYAKRREAGLCVDCGVPAVEGGVHCEQHEEGGVPWASRLERALRDGACVRCGEPCELGVCPGCVEVASTKQDHRREGHVAEGRCRCGQVRTGPEAQCAGCRRWDRERRAEVRRVEQGLMDNRARSER